MIFTGLRYASRFFMSRPRRKGEEDLLLKSFAKLLPASEQALPLLPCCSQVLFYEFKFLLNPYAKALDIKPVRCFSLALFVGFWNCFHEERARKPGIVPDAVECLSQKEIIHTAEARVLLGDVRFE
jgi:hypothetical protein